jgi:hypothetical protein
MTEEIKDHITMLMMVHLTEDMEIIKEEIMKIDLEDIDKV